MPTATGADSSPFDFSQPVLVRFCHPFFRGLLQQCLSETIATASILLALSSAHAPCLDRLQFLFIVSASFQPYLLRLYSLAGRWRDFLRVKGGWRRKERELGGELRELCGLVMRPLPHTNANSGTGSPSTDQHSHTKQTSSHNHVHIHMQYEHIRACIHATNTHV